jgi:hypothetical protein
MHNTPTIFIYNSIFFSVFPSALNSLANLLALKGEFVASKAM